MRRISDSVYAEMYYRGSNDAVIVSDDGVVLIDTPMYPIDSMAWREAIVPFGPLRYLINTEPHGDHIAGNCYFQETEVIGHERLKQRYEKQIPQMFSPERGERLKQESPDSVHFVNHPAYPPKPPTRTFTDRMSLDVGKLKLEISYVGGHTDCQTLIYLPQEGVVFPGDNIFYQTKTFVQEGSPWEWLEALDKMKALDIGVIVPGHGEPCDARYIDEQRQILENWIGVVDDFVRRGLTEDEALAQSLDMAKIDPYPLGPGLFRFSERLDGTNVKNIYGQLKERSGVK